MATMDLRQWFILGSYLFAATYSLVYLVEGAKKLRVSYVAWRTRRGAGRLARVSESTHGPAEKSRLLAAAPWLLGAAAAGSLVWFAPEGWQPYILLALTVLGLGLEEAREQQKRAYLGDVVLLLDRFRAAANGNPDLFAAQHAASEKLPGGEIRRAAEEGLRASQNGLLSTKSLSQLQRLNPYLEEFAACLRRSGWQAGDALDVTLEMILLRARSEWRSSARQAMILERIIPYAGMARSGLLGGLYAVLGLTLGNALDAAKSLDGLRLLWMSLALTASALAASIALRMILTRPWLRRSLATTAIAVSILSLTNVFGPVSAETLPTVSETATPTAVATDIETATPPVIPTDTPPTPAATVSEAATPPAPPIASRTPTVTFTASATPTGAATSVVTTTPPRPPVVLPTTARPIGAATATDEPPTATPEPPTQLPPTATLEPPTPVPATATPPPLPTSGPPTAEPPTPTPPALP